MPRPVRLPIVSAKVMVTKDCETKCLAPFIKTLCRGLNLSPGKSRAERIGTGRTRMRKLQTVGVAQTVHRNLLHEAGYQVNVVITQHCWDTLIEHKDPSREATRVWDLLFSTRLHLGGGMGGGQIPRGATFEVACGRKVGTVTAQTCTDCILISLPSEEVSLPAQDHNGLLEAMR